METFTNSILLTGNLPEIDSKTFNPLDRKYLKIIFIRISIFFLIASVVLATTLLLADEIPTKLVAILGGSIIILITAFLIILSNLEFPRKGYLVREHDISFKKGLITFKLTTVPYNRIQHVEVNQGLLPKIFQLASIKIYTAGGSYSDLSIPGLQSNEAHRLKAFLSDQISGHE